ASGLSDEDIDKMIKDAELHAEEDKAKKELVDARNTADAMVSQTEKTLKEHGDKVDDETKKKIEEGIEALKQVKDSDDKDAIKQKTDALAEASHKLAEVMYQQASQEGAAGTAGDASGAESAKQDEDVVDADFEEVDKGK
ncbi:MAG: Hsp70 family protein, partial [Desulfobacteraceae bacterium]|nr:Hsp70 family protein [Desulfobacteraceae bacterium]